jgi:hypothetical protein
MKRFLIFTLLFPPLALAVFTAPDGFKNFFDWLVYAYPAAIIPAWLTAGMDWKLSAKPALHTSLRRPGRNRTRLSAADISL